MAPFRAILFNSGTLLLSICRLVCVTESRSFHYLILVDEQQPTPDMGKQLDYNVLWYYS